MTAQERQAFDDGYTRNRKQLVDQWKSATSKSEKDRLEKRVNKLKEDYLNEVEQDW